MSVSNEVIASKQRQEEEEDIHVLTSTKSEYNEIKIVETKIAKILYLEHSGRVHSILYKDQKWTNSYWDEFTSLPSLIPQGPVAVFGLGGGTIAHQLLHFYPALSVHGWELDGVLIENARQFMGMSELETVNDAGGFLEVHIGDALSPLASVRGGYGGIVIDLFTGLKMLPELEKAETWLEMKQKLRPDGRIMINCGRASVDPDENDWQDNFTIQAMCEAFGKKLVSWKKMSKSEKCRNYLAVTGPFPDLNLWSNVVPEKLRDEVALWKSCDLP